MENQSEDSSKRILSTENLINPLTVMLFLALLIIFTLMLSNGIILLLEQWLGLSLADAFEKLKYENSRFIRSYVRLALLINHLAIFILPSLIVTYFFYKKNWKNFLQLNFQPIPDQIVNCLFSIVLVVASFPLAQLALKLNQQIPLPDWARRIETDTEAMLQNLLVADAPLELFFNIAVIAIIPGIGEELLFRGVIQRNLEKFFKNPHKAIWIAAIIFSAFHMQFEGFLPRMLLGAMLGYLYYFSKNLWVPIIAHMVYNAFQIVAAYLYASEMSSIDIEQIDQTPLGLIIFSIIFVSGIGYYFIRFNTSKMADQ